VNKETNIKRLIYIFTVIFVSIIADQLSKVAAQQWIGSDRYSFLGDTLRLGVTENTGAFLGMGSNLDEGIRTAIFIVLTAIFLIGLLAYILINKKVNGLELLSWCLLLGGGLGNLIDRGFRNGHVVDFLNVGIGSLRTGIFNVADMVIMAGAFILIYLSFRPSTHSQKQ